MDDDDKALAFGMALAFIIGVSIGLVGVVDTRHRYQREAIEHGAAEYNATTGDWQWKEKAEK